MLKKLMVSTLALGAMALFAVPTKQPLNDAALAELEGGLWQVECDNCAINSEGQMICSKCTFTWVD